MNNGNSEIREENLPLEVKTINHPSGQKTSRFIYSKLNAACWIILIHELLERFAFYGMKGLLTLFLKDYLNFSSGPATSIYHLFSATCYLMPLLGAIISDNYLGRFKTVAIFGIVYLFGHAILTFSSLTWNRTGPLIGLFTLAVGSGIIKPCVAAFGGDQTPPNNEEVTEAFFSLFYMCINVGAFISQLSTPILKENVDCVDGQCYPLAFGVPAAAFLLTYIIFIAGKPLYRFLDGEDNVFVRSMKLIGHSIVRKFRLRKTGDKRESFLDYGDDLYDSKFINDVKIVMNVLFLYLPFPIFWALFDQQGSRWSVQASQMDGYLTESLVIYPEQMQMINPLLIIIVIPTFNNIIYPLLNKCNVLTRPPSRMIAGYVFAALSFGIAGILQFQIDKGLIVPTLPASESSVRIINLGPCDMTIKNPKIFLPGGQTTKECTLSAPKNMTLEIGSSMCGVADQNLNMSLAERSKYTIGVAVSGSSIVMSPIIQDREANRRGSKIRFMASPALTALGGVVELTKGKVRTGSVVMNFSNPLPVGLFATDYLPLTYGHYTLHHRVGNTSNALGEFESQTGMIATVALVKFNATSQSSTVLLKEVAPRLLKMPLQIPQYLLMTFGEVLFSVTSMSFAYSESPTSMKAIMQSVYLVTIFFGNIIVTIVAAVPSLPSQSWEFLLFAGLVLVAGFLQGVLAYFYHKNKAKRLAWLETEEKEQLKKYGFEDADTVDEGLTTKL